MAKDELRFDVIGNDRASSAFSRVGESAGTLSRKMDIASKSAAVLDEAMNRQRTAARSSVDATLALAKADDILAEAEHTLRDGALEAELALKKEAEAKRKSGEAAEAAAAKNEAFNRSLQKAATSARKSGPGWLGPALLAAPIATTVAGVGAGAAIGLGGALATASVAMAAYGMVAKSVLSQASTATQAVSKAQNAYNLAIASGTKQAVAYKTEQLAIAKAYAGMSPAQIQLSRQLGGISDQWSRFRQSVTPLIASSLQPWLKGVGIGLQSLKSLITPMGPVVHDLGTQFATLTGSSVFKTFAAWVGTTGAAVTRSAGNAVLDLITGITFILPQFTPLITGASNGISKWGDAFVKWSASQKAANEIHGFLQWFHDNGPAVTGLLKNVGGALKALAPGLGPASVAEIKIVSNFFGFVAKLPPGLARPLTETAGALLLLNKVGVVSVGIKLVGLAGLTGTTGAIAAGGAGIAGGLILRVREDLKSGFKGIVHDIPSFLSGVPGILSLSAQGWADTITSKFNKPVAREEKKLGHDLASIFDGIRHDVSHIWDLMWNNTVGRLNRGSADTLKILGGWQHNVSHWFDVARHDVASSWDTAWNNTVGRTARGVGDVARWVSTIPGRVTSIFRSAGSWLYGKGRAIVTGLWNGVKNVWSSVSSWFHGLPHKILKALGIASPPKWSIDAGKHIMGGILKGLAHGGDIKSFFMGKVSSVFGYLKDAGTGIWHALFGGGAKYNPGKGVAQWKGLVDQALGKLGLPRSLDANVLYQMQTESGGNPNAINLTDSNAAAGDPSRGLMQVIMSTFRAYHVPGTSNNIYDPYANIAAAINYAEHVYGRNLANSFGGIGSGHGYALGTLSAAPGWAWVGERGPELMHFRGGEQVVPAHAARGGNIYLTVNAPVGSNSRDIGRQLAEYLGQHIKGGGRIYPAGVTPR